MGDSLEDYTVEVDQASETEWNSLLEGFSDASIYQTWAYGAVHWGDRQLSHLVLRRRGSPFAMAQVRIVGVPILKTGMAYVRWGPLCAASGGGWNPLSWQAVLESLAFEYVIRRGLTLRLLPNVFNEDAAAQPAMSLCAQAGFHHLDGSTGPYRTFRIDLQLPIEVLRKQLAHKWRNQLNASERNGLELAEGADPGLFAEFVALYREMTARKRFNTTVDVSEFEQMQTRLPPSQKMVTLLARQDGRAVSGLVASTVGATATYLLGATGDGGLTAKGAYLLQWYLIRRLKERGCRWYDLGGINPVGNPGVFHFKQGLGGAEALHLGQFDRHPHRLGQLAVGAAEIVKAFAGRFPIKAK